MSSRPARRAVLVSTLAALAVGGSIPQTAVAQSAPTGGTSVPTTPVQAQPAARPVSETQTVKLTRPQVKSVQRRAKVRPDGALGARTRAALRTYQSKKRLARTGRPNLQTLKTMKLAFAETIEQRLAAKARSAPATSTAPAGFTFPLQGDWSFGGSATAFGDRGGAHQGIDLLSPCGTPVVAASSGTVKTNASQSAAGNYVVLTDTPSGEDQVYMHLQSRSTLKVGDAVTAGSPIAPVGDTGNATACLLHVELWTAPGWYEGGRPRDPRPDIEAWSGTASAR